ncbi:S41 family peptidase [Xylocopilactobacillus apis]|uniref:Peptidase S41 n=1 Tax=Xylocopilactobacillus apis TaxID=2932183 RepID=A0AAU9CYP7_9LACO|nr:S41 family peptidase [Xylocopilactobacillus apis]BDR56529.1 peptidase S41 [Xylocopilactobacillus apis]
MNNTDNSHSNSKIRTFLVGILVLAIGVLIGFFIPHTQKPVTERHSESSETQKSTKKESNDDYLSQVKNLIKTKYYQPVDETKLTNGSIKGMLDSLDDPYTTYLDKQEAQSLTDTISSSIVGIGVTVMEKNKLIVVDSTVSGTPAKKAGIRSKDIIVKVNGKSVLGKRSTEVTKLIRGKKGTSVTVTVRRGSKDIDFKMTRDTIPIETVKHKMLTKNIGYLSVSTFSNPTTSEFKKAITSLRKSGAKKFVVDMRGNPGGELKQALSMSSMFVKDGKTIMQVQGRQKSDLTVYDAGPKMDGGFKVTEPTVVLIDGDSASAAEIFTAALKSSNIPVVGKKSFGKGTVQSVVELPDDAELKMTIAKWLTPDGSWIHHKGIKPDYVVNYPEYTNLIINDVKKPLKKGDVSGNVKTIQKGLLALGYQPGNQKGIFDDATENAVKDFQTKRKISVNGTIDESTVQEVLRALSELEQKQDPMQKKAIDLLQN